MQDIQNFVGNCEHGLGEVMVVKVHGITDNNCMAVFGYDVVAMVVVQVCREIQDRGREGLWCMPMGPIGVALKFNLPMRASAEVAVPVELGQSKLRVSLACGRRRSHQLHGKLVGTPARMAKKWSLKVWMTHSTALWQWTCSSTNWYVLLSLLMVGQKAALNLLCMMWIVGDWLAVRRWLWMS